MHPAKIPYNMPNIEKSETIFFFYGLLAITIKSLQRLT